MVSRSIYLFLFFFFAARGFNCFEHAGAIVSLVGKESEMLILVMVAENRDRVGVSNLQPRSCNSFVFWRGDPSLKIVI